jgi:hypothetical protein
MPRPSIYPWDKWLRMGNRLRIVRGKDYNCQPYAMTIRLRQEASKRNRRVSLNVVGDIITATVLKKRSNS